MNPGADRELRPGHERAFEIFRATALDDKETAYPNGARFIGADMPGFETSLHRALREKEPVVVVYPDGDVRILEPREPRKPGRFEALARRLGLKHR